MESEYPTYNLGDNFQLKLKKYVDKLISDGMNHFSHEFDKIDGFVRQTLLNNSERDDIDFISTPKEKYLIEMISFKVYDELNRDAFNKTKDTLIIMPHCLSLHNTECEKAETKYGEVCKRCLTTCPAHSIVDMATNYKTKVMFSKRKLSAQLEHFANKSDDLAVIGISCVLTLADGMRTASELGIPSRGVLLSCTGCEHWNKIPFGSEVSLEWVKEILEEKYG